MHNNNDPFYSNFIHFDDNNMNQIMHNILSNSGDSFMAKLYVNKKHTINDNLDDSIGIPQFETERLLNQDIQTVEISFGENKVIGKVTKYDSNPRTILLPQWMINKLGAKENDLVKIITKKIDQITKLSVKCPKEITNSLTILEFEMRDRNLLYKNNVFIVKIFDKEYRFIIENIYNNNKEIEVGILYNNGLSSEIFFDIIIY